MTLEFNYRIHSLLEKKIKRNQYMSFIDLITGLTNTTNTPNINNIISLSNLRSETLLHIAVKFKRINIIQYLLNNFIQLKIVKNSKGETPFFQACKYGYIYIVRLFLNSQDFMSFINIKDNYNYSPLLKSYKKRHYPIATLLLEKGADWNVMSIDGYIIPQNFIYNFINRNNMRFQQLIFSPISSPRINLNKTENTILKVIKPNIEIINTIKQLYINKNELCPITYEPLTIETSSITSCYHAFDKNAIQDWFKTKNNCPVCREKCEIW
jgi:ankyrin repeat protein